MNDVSSIVKQIIEDKQKSGSYDRYPIRFLFMDLNNDTQQDIVKIVSGIKVNPLFKNSIRIKDISEELSFNDAWITKSKMLSIVSDLDANTDYFITGFSELARFYSRQDLEALLLSFMTNIENTSGGKQRIYFVCFSLFDKIAQELRTNSRNESINPIINGNKYKEAEDEIDKICVYYTNSSLSSEVLGNKISSSKEWLNIYKNGHINYDKGIVCVSDALVMLYEQAKPDNFVDIEKLDNHYKLLVFIHGMKLRNVDESFLNDSFWKDLYDYCQINDVYNLETIVKKVLNVNEVNDLNIISLLSDNKKLFNKQLLHLYIYENQNSFEYADYLIKLFNSTAQEGYLNFEKTIITDFSLVSTDLELNARKKLCSKIPDNTFVTFEGELSESINNTLRLYLTSKISWYDFSVTNLSGLNSAELSKEVKLDVSNYLTDYANNYFAKFYVGRTVIEKGMLLSLLQNKIVDTNYVFKLCPDYQYYLGSNVSEYLDVGHQQIEQYIYEYKFSKLTNKPTEKYLSLIEQNANDFYSWYYSNPSYQFTLDIIHNVDYDLLYVLDGVGCEFFDYLIYLVGKHGKIITYSNIGKSYLPSITSVNKEAFNNIYDEWFLNFDENIIHGTVYSPTNGIAKALNEIEKTIESIIDKHPNELIAITADHGCTAGNRIIRPSKKYNFPAEHEGRCYKVDQYYKDNEDYAYITSTNKEHWLVATRELSLGDNPKREAHGGATFEEVFVPIVVFGNKSYANQVKHSVELKSGLLSGLNRSVTIEILPPTEKAPVIVEDDGSKHIMKKVSNNIWVSPINSIKSQVLTVKVGNSDYKVSVSSSLGASQIGDDGFDD
ncbi:MAG: BREX-4 system phosphatase PglZ [Oceanobacillus sp.]|nr:BREX-4 system phosphatase PglZ [Oceanobacillus sp.]